MSNRPSNYSIGLQHCVRRNLHAHQETVNALVLGTRRNGWALPETERRPRRDAGTFRDVETETTTLPVSYYKSAAKRYYTHMQSYLARVVTVACFTSLFIESDILSLWTRLSTHQRRTVGMDAQRSCNVYLQSTLQSFIDKNYSI